ncbi:MAG: hypothetical protein Fur0035_06380 [Anaerolineales bacterium]
MKINRRNFSVGLAVFLLALASLACLISPGAPSIQPSATPAPAVVATSAEGGPTRAPLVPSQEAPASGEAVQTTMKQLPAGAKVGQLQVDYPALLLPGGSKTIEVAVYVPVELAGADPAPFIRDLIPENPKPLLGSYERYHALIFLSSAMRAELIAPGFTVSELYPAYQPVEIDAPNTTTHWAWAILAPQQPGEYVATVRLFLQDEISPRWVGSFTIGVAQPTPTATAQPDPGDGFISGVGKITGVIAALGALLAAIAGVVKIFTEWKKK